ncbi:OsmC family protein [Spirillospora sp. NPDC047279]|uniref:OsmC family protein n=1 Tax=Spirillospora sp. NPDC047279 TaxID=3155478 RepID=UPI0033FB396A
MNEIKVIHRQADSFAILVRDHVVHVDQPYSAGGQDAGPTPVELFVGSLASCAAHYGHRHLERLGLPAEGLEVTAEYTMSAARPNRVARVGLLARPPAGVPVVELDGLRAAMEQCTVHNSLIRPPQLDVHIEIHARAA